MTRPIAYCLIPLAYLVLGIGYCMVFIVECGVSAGKWIDNEPGGSP